MRTRRLIVVTPEGERELLFIGRLTIGRAPECDISLADTKISRRHAEFDASGPMPRVVDLSSRNGILVNGRKTGSAELMPGDVVTVGDAQIRFEERAVELPEPAAAPAPADDRTAILPPMVPPVPAAAPPSPPAPVPPEEWMDGVPGAVGSFEGDKTSIVSGWSAVAPPAPRLLDDASAEHTLVLPPPARVAPLHGGSPPASHPHAGSARFDAPPERAPAPVVARPVAAAPALAPPMMPIPLAPAPRAAATVPSPAPAAAPAATPSVSTAAATGSALKGPRLSWSGLVTLAAVVLGGLAVLLGALPLMSASSSALDALSQRQARTLAGWLAAGVKAQGNAVVDPAVMEAVLAQPGVERAMVLERATGRAMAPASLGGRSYSALPGLGEGWRDLTVARVGRVDAFADAYVPAGQGAYIAWVRYERPSSDDTGLAIMVALVSTLAFAMLVALLIKRHTRATLQHFTRQVELAVSGASPKVMQGALMPGLDRLPGVVTYLLEQRRAAGTMPTRSAGNDLGNTDDPATSPVAITKVDPGPPWLELTPSLMIAESSTHGPAAGAPGWSTARGRHLLDVLDNGPVRNAVVQGLGALGMRSGSEATVPIPDGAPIALRRESSGHVRVTLGAR